MQSKSLKEALDLIEEILEEAQPYKGGEKVSTIVRKIYEKLETTGWFDFKD